MYTHKAYPIYLEESKGIPKPGKDPSSPKSYRPNSLLCIPYKLYERLILMRISHMSMRSWQKTSRLQTCSFMWRSAPELDSAHRRRLPKTDVEKCSICRPVSCIRHSSTPINDKKADGHDRRHGSMPGDSMRPHQSWATWKSKMAAMFSRWPPFSLLKLLF